MAIPVYSSIPLSLAEGTEGSTAVRKLAALPGEKQKGWEAQKQRLFRQFVVPAVKSVRNPDRIEENTVLPRQSTGQCLQSPPEYADLLQRWCEIRNRFRKS